MDLMHMILKKVEDANRNGLSLSEMACLRDGFTIAWKEQNKKISKLEDSLKEIRGLLNNERDIIKTMTTSLEEALKSCIHTVTVGTDLGPVLQVI